MIGKRIPPAIVSMASTAPRPDPDKQPATGRCPIEEPHSLLQALLEALPDAVFLIDRASMRFVDVNPAACRSLGYSRDELLAMGPHQITTAGPRRGMEAEFDNVIRGGAPAAVRRVSHRRKSGQRFAVQWFLRAVQHQSDHLLVLVAREVLAGREGVSHSAGPSGALHGGGPVCDSLTGLPGREAFEQRLQRAMEAARRDAAYAFAVFFVDLDGFKPVNDHLGHQEGDRLLREVAGRLAACIRPGDMVARHGGDEFTVLVDNLRDRDDALGVAERMRAETVVHTEVDGKRRTVTASIGIALSRPEYRYPAELIHDADQAMYRAKARGKARFAFFDHDAG